MPRLTVSRKAGAVWCGNLQVRRGPQPLDAYLRQVWEHHQRGSLWQKWAAANPREHALVDAYWLDPKAVPAKPGAWTETGLGYVNLVAAYWKAKT